MPLTQLSRVQGAYPELCRSGGCVLRETSFDGVPLLLALWPDSSQWVLAGDSQWPSLALAAGKVLAGKMSDDRLFSASIGGVSRGYIRGGEKLARFRRYQHRYPCTVLPAECPVNIEQFVSADFDYWEKKGFTPLLEELKETVNQLSASARLFAVVYGHRTVAYVHTEESPGVLHWVRTYWLERFSHVGNNHLLALYDLARQRGLSLDLGPMLQAYKSLWADENVYSVVFEYAGD